MENFRGFNRMLMVVIFAVPFFGGCGYAIRYNLNQREIVKSSSPAPLKVQVATFSDKRDGVEREKSARKAKGVPDAGDYTYDKEFRGKVAEEMTKMLVNHLNYSNVFSSQATPAAFSSAQLSDALLDSLARKGFDAVLTGELANFYGYYDQNLGRALAYMLPLGVASGLLLNFSTTSGNTQTTFYWYGPGLVLGSYLESLHPRRIAKHVQFSARLISTKTHQPLWENRFDVAETAKRSMPGISTEQRKYQVAVWSLREAVNQMVESLAKSSF